MTACTTNHYRHRPGEYNAAQVAACTLTSALVVHIAGKVSHSKRGVLRRLGLEVVNVFGVLLVQFDQQRCISALQ